MEHAVIAELVIFVSCTALFFGYHVWLFFLRPFLKAPLRRHHHIDIYTVSHKSKGVWAEVIIEDDRDGLPTYSMQTLRHVPWA